MSARRCIDPGSDAEVNVVGTVNVLEAVGATSAHLSSISTGGVIYGDVDGPASEAERAAPPRPAYGLAKRSAEVYVDGWNRMFGPGMSCPPRNVYGPRESAALEAA